MRGSLLIVLFGVLLWGCARPQPPVLEFDDMTLYFGSRSADLVSSEREKIIRLAGILGAGHEVTVTIAGFAGAPGDSADRMNRLALARTLAVRDALVADLKESRARRIRVAYRACGIGDGAPPVHRVDIHVADGMTGAADLCDDHDPTSGGGVTTIAQPI
jgi:hypothetical protein